MSTRDDGEILVVCEECGHVNHVDLSAQPDIVRCKDCKHWNGYYRQCESVNWDTGTDEFITTPAGMFCGWGERRLTDETD